VKQVQRFIRDGHRVAVDLDVDQFFDRADLDVLMARLGRRVTDQRLLRLIGRFLRAGVEVNAEKSQVAPTDQVSFLGFSFHGAKICWPAKTLARFQREVKEFTNRNWGASMRRRLTEPERYHGAIS
jgi:hypothetical protein